MADGDLQLGGGLSGLLGEETDKAGSNAVRCLGRQGDGLIRDTWDGDAANVAAVRELLEIIIRQWQ